MDKLISFAVGLVTGTALYAIIDNNKRLPYFIIDKHKENKEQNEESNPNEEDTEEKSEATFNFDNFSADTIVNSN